MPVLEALSMPFILYGKSGQSGETHLETSDLSPFMHHLQYSRMAFFLIFGFCFPFPDRKGYKEQSTKLQIETSFGNQPEQFRHLSLIAFRRLRSIVF
jgi:hypothetical protein